MKLYYDKTMCRLPNAFASYSFTFERWRALYNYRLTLPTGGKEQSQAAISGRVSRRGGPDCPRVIPAISQCTGRKLGLGAYMDVSKPLTEHLP